MTIERAEKLEHQLVITKRQVRWLAIIVGSVILVYAVKTNRNELYWRWVGVNTTFEFKRGDYVNLYGYRAMGKVIRRDICWRNRGASGVLVAYNDIPTSETPAEVYQIRVGHMVEGIGARRWVYEIDWYDVCELSGREVE